MRIALAVFESRYRDNMEADEAKKLVRDAIAAGVFNDLGSGSNIDLCVITKDKVELLQPYEVANNRGIKQGNYKYPKGSTAVLEVVSTTVQREEPMEE